MPTTEAALARTNGEVEPAEAVKRSQSTKWTFKGRELITVREDGECTIIVCKVNRDELLALRDACCEAAELLER